ncbi:hypothetical protein HMPREF9102_2094 [Limosilactobacillus oris F0423]|uniref:Uncharacterized protein n=1 Tax=Limosilactobacillus oris F0423 TaxID=944562 RepID=A0ABP2LA11_9LACO|nr:hypothetical protein HMPREF9102_2094 [Limosilactobacillus oris F0423]
MGRRFFPVTHCIFIFVLLPFFSKKQLKKLIKFMIELLKYML